jgi:hypothetical protein
MTIIDNHTNDWKTVSSSDTVTIPQDQSSIQAQPQHQTHSQIHISRRPTDRLEEFFYEQAKFFRHLERKYERFNQKSREDEQYARAGKFRHRPKPTPEQIQQQQQAKPVVHGPYTLKQQQALDQRRAQRQASNQQQGQASGSTQKESARNSKGEVLKGK